MCRGNRWGRRGIASVVCLVVVLILLVGGAGAVTLEAHDVSTTHSVAQSGSWAALDTRADANSAASLEGIVTQYRSGFDEDEEIDARSRPEGASVYVDGEFVGETPWRDDGEYDDPVDIRVELDSGESKTYTDVTAPETIRADFEDGDDEPERGTLSVDSDPRGATVLVDDREVGETPWEDDLSVDESVTVTLEKSGYETVRETDVGAGDELVFSLEASDQPLEIAAVDAPRFVDASMTSVDIETTIENLGSAERTETLSLTLEGTEIDRQSVTLAGGEHTTVTFTPEIEGEGGETLEYRLSLDADDELGQIVFESSADDGGERGGDEEEAGGDDGPTSPDSLSVDAGDDRAVTVDPGDRLVLGTTVSSDPPADDTLSVSWTQLEGPSVDLEDETTVAPAFSVPERAVPATVTFEVTATIDDRKATDTVTLTLESTADGATDDTSSDESDEADGDAGGDENGTEETKADGPDDEPSDEANEVEDAVDSDGDDSAESAVRGDIATGGSALVTPRLGFILALVTGMVAHRQLLNRE
ncbi:PEGA domain-containing protein [Halobacteria archaeon AArc-curdl1]|uniref:PEGA domain-containing protein n=1 Tax=Natronosalvus hydrolyticus TaxID=2979988 RepID=A0AAP2ZBJ8_9EURY|nr:PEGA domain-containing protein [Halobacteria archaeon AArc-curdl1]